MPSNTKLLPHVPHYVDKTDRHIIAWRQDLHHEAIEHLNQTRLEKPSASMLRLIALVLTYALGALGLASPQFVAQVLKLLLH